MRRTGTVGVGGQCCCQSGAGCRVKLVEQIGLFQL